MNQDLTRSISASFIRTLTGSDSLLQPQVVVLVLQVLVLQHGLHSRPREVTAWWNKLETNGTIWTMWQEVTRASTTCHCSSNVLLFSHLTPGTTRGGHVIRRRASEPIHSLTSHQRNDEKNLDTEFVCV